MTKSEKVRKKKKRKKKHYLLKLIILVGIVAGLYYLLNSSIFDIQRVTVENNNYYTSEQVIRIAEASTGENLFKASTSSMKEKLLADPYIKNTKINRKLPSEIVITVYERNENAAVPYGNNYIIIDEEGMVLKMAEIEPALTLLLGMTVKNIEPGTPLEVEENAILTDTLKMLNEVEKHELFFKKIDISKVIIKAYIYDQLTCEGTPENIMNNLDSLKDVLYDLYTKGIERGVIKMGSDEYFSFSPLME